MAIWVCADLHLQHKNIIGYCRKQFNSVEEHDKYVIERYNSVVGKDDLVYILGDLGFTPKESLTQLVRQLNGRKILIIGNHDSLKDNDYINMGIIQVIRHPIFYNNNIILSHIPVEECYNSKYAICVHGHLHGNLLTLPNFFNVNVELTDYLPINIEIFEEKAKELCIRYRWQPFGQEWYHEYYKIPVEKKEVRHHGRGSKC